MSEKRGEPRPEPTGDERCAAVAWTTRKRCEVKIGVERYCHRHRQMIAKGSRVRDALTGDIVTDAALAPPADAHGGGEILSDSEVRALLGRVRLAPTAEARIALEATQNAYAALRARLRQAEEERDRYKERALNEAQAVVDIDAFAMKVQATAARYREALEWYAEKAQAIERYMRAEPPMADAVMAVVDTMRLDKGDRARRALDNEDRGSS